MLRGVGSSEVRHCTDTQPLALPAPARGVTRRPAPVDVSAETSNVTFCNHARQPLSRLPVQRKCPAFVVPWLLREGPRSILEAHGPCLLPPLRPDHAVRARKRLRAPLQRADGGAGHGAVVARDVVCDRRRQPDRGPAGPVRRRPSTHRVVRVMNPPGVSMTISINAADDLVVHSKRPVRVRMERLP